MGPKDFTPLKNDLFAWERNPGLQSVHIEGGRYLNSRKGTRRYYSPGVIFQPEPRLSVSKDAVNV